jgi:hypothetical protein
MTDEQAQTVEGQDQKVGSIGLWLAIGGMVLPILIAILCYMAFDEDVTFLCALLFVACEVAALGCGIASGKEDRSGRAALVISAVSLVLSVLLLGFLTPVRFTSSGPNGPSSESIPVRETETIQTVQ